MDRRRAKMLSSFYAAGLSNKKPKKISAECYCNSSFTNISERSTYGDVVKLFRFQKNEAKKERKVQKAERI